MTSRDFRRLQLEAALGPRIPYRPDYSPYPDYSQGPIRRAPADIPVTFNPEAWERATGGGGDTPEGGDEGGGGDSPGSYHDLMEEARILFPWMPEHLLSIYVNSWIETGDPTLAWAYMQQSPEYDDYFPGMRREDGSLRFSSEQEYISTKEAYRRIISEVGGINPDLFEHRYIELIEGDVHPSEFEFRVASLFENVMNSAPEIRDWYARNYALDLTDEAILATALDPTGVGNAILTKQIGIAQVGGEAAIRQFEIAAALAERLYDVGIDTRGEASELFGLAAGMVPALNTLAKRHADPDDDFDLEEFVYASVMDDPNQRRRMNRLIAQERSSFRRMGGVRMGAGGGLVGLGTL